MECPDTHYSFKERCCLKCAAGEKVEEHCKPGQNNTTKCKPCTNGTDYQDSPNGQMDCIPCGKQYKANRVLLQHCTRFHDKKYGDCEKGFYHNINLDVCQKCSTCRVGYGVKKKCTKEANTECEQEKCGVVSPVYLRE